METGTNSKTHECIDDKSHSRRRLVLRSNERAFRRPGTSVAAKAPGQVIHLNGPGIPGLDPVMSSVMIEEAHSEYRRRSLQVHNHKNVIGTDATT